MTVIHACIKLDMYTSERLNLLMLTISYQPDSVLALLVFGDLEIHVVLYSHHELLKYYVHLSQMRI